ncbi:LTA synthase family protein [Mesobacillus sp. LC4]
MKKVFDRLNLNKAKIWYILLLLLAPLVSLLAIESIHRGSFAAALKWIQESSAAFVISYLFFLLFISTVLFIPKKLFIPFIILQLAFFSVVAFGSYQKFKLRGDYLTPTDLGLVKEGAAFANVLDGFLSVKMAMVAIIVLAFIFGAVYYLMKITEPLKLKIRLMISVIAIAGTAAILLNPTVFSIRASAVGNVEEYQKLGLVGGFLNLKEESKVVHPTEYSKREINKIVESLPETEGVDEDFKPNVIVVLAEAFWDPLLLKNLSFEEDPIPYYRSLTKEHSSGELLTHIFGGGTINTELEIMTGMSTRFLPEGKESYNAQVNRPIDALPHVFRNQGYNTTAVHTFKNWFYDRNLTYKWLGYEKFVSMEFFSNPKMIGPYIDDRELMKQTVKELKKTEGPDFINTVTVSSHGPYDDIRYDPLPSCKNTPQLTKVPQYVLDLYCQVLKETDDSIRVLIEGVKELDEPTMVVIYGDHLPMLGYDYAVYREADYFKSIHAYEDYLKLQTTPLLVWDNYSEGKKEDLRMTPNFLGSYILSHAKRDKSPMFAMAEKVYEEGTHVIPKKPFYADENIDENKLKEYQLLQYDTLFGEQYSYKKNPVKPHDDYFLGSEKMKITKLKMTEKDNLKVSGKHFVSNAKIFINGEQQTTIFNDEKTLIASVPEKFNGKEIEVVVKVLDDKENSIAESNGKKMMME